MKRALALAIALLLATPASAETIAGRASVIDGDTLEVHGERIRILDIDALETPQLCQDQSGVEWRCGQKAALALSDWIGQQPVTCETTRKDKYKRWLAGCSVGGVDLAEWLAGHGWAVPYRDCKCEVVRAAADMAQLERIGIWSGTFMMPWDWRARQATQTTSEQSAGQPTVTKPTTSQSVAACDIKGNISSKGERIYHVPGGKWYEKTKISPSKGERWFCSEAEARVSGWRPAVE